MGKSLIIAEKPSVAQDIVRALTPLAGKFEKHAEHFENERYVVTSAVGHLVEIKAPEEYDVKRGKWSFAHLPVIPPHFELAPIDKAKTRLNAVVKLCQAQGRRPTLINACDAGREGELIFRLIEQYAAGAKGALGKPVRRLWLQSMTPQAIRDGFEQLRSDAQMRGLADAARSRSEADWLVGINGTRAMTAFNSRDGGFFLTTVGRVQTPDAVDRRGARGEDPPATWRAPTGRCAPASTRRPAATRASGSTRRGRRTPRTPRHAPTACGATADGRRPSRRPAAASPPAVTEEAKPSTQASPLLYDLTTLQREANSPLRLLGQDDAVARRRPCTRSTRCSPTRVPTRGRCRRTTSATVQADLARCSPTRDLPGPLARACPCTRRKALADGYVKPTQAASSTTPRSRTTSPSSRRWRRRGASTRPRPSSTTWWSSASWRCSTRSAEFLVTTRVSTVQAGGASYRFQTNGKVLVQPGLARRLRQGGAGRGRAASCP
jgi:DNA topoisomerase-3